jgi:hypothetical protein
MWITSPVNWKSPWTRQRQQAELRQQVQSRPITFSTRAFVRVRKPLNTWVSWHPRLGGGPQLILRDQALEVSAPQGMMLESRDIFLATDYVTMWRDRVGWAGTPLDRRECIRLRSDHEAVEVAVSPDSGIEGTWNALLQVGVRPRQASE